MRRIKKHKFSERVLKVVSKIPKGKTLSYKEVAELAGSPNAARAVGNIMNANRNPNVPCHRIIKSDGSIGGYNSGVAKKKRLLKNEGICSRKLN
jgi:O-6-methylguanine DNA methyltransferase